MRKCLVWPDRAFVALLAIALLGAAQEPVPAQSGSMALEEDMLARERKPPYVCDGLDRPDLHSKAVLEAMARVPRHKFVPQDMREYAYDDNALSVGYGQTISQPYIVALMTQEADITPGEKVLEIGTGSGYQAAVLAELGAKVFTIEIVPELAARAQETLKELGYKDINVRQGDGFKGWKEEAPFDAILVTAASPGYPPALLEQLADHGRMIIPVERKHFLSEDLMMVERKGDEYISTDLGGVKFVPLTGEVRTKKKEVIRNFSGKWKVTK